MKVSKSGKILSTKLELVEELHNQISPSQLQMEDGLKKLEEEARLRLLRQYCDKATASLVKRKLLK